MTFRYVRQDRHTAAKEEQGLDPDSVGSTVRDGEIADIPDGERGIGESGDCGTGA